MLSAVRRVGEYVGDKHGRELFRGMERYCDLVGKKCAAGAGLPAVFIAKEWISFFLELGIVVLSGVTVTMHFLFSDLSLEQNLPDLLYRYYL